jgi:hypothetical protein
LQQANAQQQDQSNNDRTMHLLHEQKRMMGVSALDRQEGKHHRWRRRKQHAESHAPAGRIGFPASYQSDWIGVRILGSGPTFHVNHEGFNDA